MELFLSDFDEAYSRIRRHGVFIRNKLLRFKILKTANLSNHHEWLIKAIITEVSYDNIIKKIKLILNNLNNCEKQNKANWEMKQIKKWKPPSTQKKLHLMKMNLKQMCGCYCWSLLHPCQIQKYKTIHQKHQTSWEIKHNPLRSLLKY